MQTVLLDGVFFSFVVHGWCGILLFVQEFRSLVLSHWYSMLCCSLGLLIIFIYKEWSTYFQCLLAHCCSSSTSLICQPCCNALVDNSLRFKDITLWECSFTQVIPCMNGWLSLSHHGLGTKPMMRFRLVSRLFAPGFVFLHEAVLPLSTKTLLFGLSLKSCSLFHELCTTSGTHRYPEVAVFITVFSFSLYRGQNILV